MEGLISKRSIQVRFILILTVVTFGVSILAFTLLYHMTLSNKKAQLIEIAEAQAGLMEAMGKFNAFFQSGDLAGASRSATLSQIRESHRQYDGFGDTGEVVLAELRGNRIRFLSPTRKEDFEIPDAIDHDSALGAPMQLALAGKSGVFEGPDYAGDNVLAAYEYLPFLDMGLVVKIDKSEVLAPYIRAGLISGGIAVLLIALGVLLNIMMVNPLINKVYEFAGAITVREERYRTLVSHIPGAVFRSRADPERTMMYMSEPITDITGYGAADFIENQVRSFGSIVHPDDAQILQHATEGYLRSGKSYSIEYRIMHTNGVEKWVYEQGSVLTDETNGGSYLDGVIIDISDLKKAEQAVTELSRKLSKYLSPQVYQSIFEGSQDVKIGSARKKLTVFFSDLVNFTETSESLEAEDLSHVLNSYLNRMAQITIEHGGTLDKFIGDGIMVFFGDPESRGIKEDATACVEMALAMGSAVDELKAEWVQQGIDVPLQVRMGIATGFCTVGNFGSENRMDYTILGSTVNLASRLESTADPGALLVSHETYITVESQFECVTKDPISVKGFDHPVQTYAVVDTIAPNSTRLS